jgi:oxaloacetate decarboxylase alpha subunit
LKEEKMPDFNLIKKLIDTLEERGLTALVVEEKDTKIEVRKEGFPVSPTSGPGAHVRPHVEPIAHAPSAAPSEDDGLLAITSPMVGTFYRTPSPGAKPFVEVGDMVKIGQVACIIEAMKLFNEIESEVAGKVEKILVENGQPVEYGQKLILIRKA